MSLIYTLIAVAAIISAVYLMRLWRLSRLDERKPKVYIFAVTAVYLILLIIPMGYLAMSMIS